MQVFDGNEEQLVPLILQSLFGLISLPNLIAVGLVGMGTDYWSQKFSQKIFTKKILNLLYFSNLRTIYSKIGFDMEYKRKQRGLSDITKKKISTALKGRRKSLSHSTNISKGLERYWSQIPIQKSDSTTNNGL